MTSSVAADRSARTTVARRTATALAALAALAVLVTGACGSDDDTAAVPARGGASGPTADQTFSLLVADLFVAVTRAGTDLCQLQFALPEEPLEPTTSAQATQSVTLRVAWLRAVSDAMPAGSEVHAQVLRDAATALLDGAAEEGFPVDFWSGPVAAATLSSEPYAAAMLQRSALVAAQCPEDDSVVIPSG